MPSDDLLAGLPAEELALRGLANTRAGVASIRLPQCKSAAHVCAGLACSPQKSSLRPWNQIATLSPPQPRGR